MAWFSGKTDASLPSSVVPSSTAHRWKYDVFLSFNSEDTQRGFTSKLKGRLSERRIKTYSGDEREYTVGSPIYFHYLKDIEEARFAIVVLSPNYASSSGCLAQLVRIFECMIDLNRIIPVFYHVDPADVRHQTGEYGSEKVNQWRETLRKVSSLSGWHIRDNDDDNDRVAAIVTSVCIKLGYFEATEQDMNNKVMKALEINEVTAVGVHFRGGLGKKVVEHIRQQVRDNGLFDHVIMVLVHQRPDLRKIQGTVANQLGVKLGENNALRKMQGTMAKQLGFNLEEDRRAAKLRNEMMSRNKILIILDDIWERIDLLRIGIPSYEELYKCKSKILLMTMLMNVCHDMRCQATITLSEKDSCTSLGSTAGCSSGPTNLVDVARTVGGECADLPSPGHLKSSEHLLATNGNVQPVVEINTADLEAFEATRLATIEPTLPKSSEDFAAVEATTQATNGNLQPVVEINTADLEAFEATRLATIEIEPTLAKSTEDFEAVEAVEATTQATNGNSPLWKHDVFLSFRGVDIRDGFLSHLYHELENTKVIRTFKDEEQLEKGKDISQSLLMAIEESRFAIVVLSKNYASSVWCLNELTKIVQCMEGKDTILPIFYHVDPSDVRYQKNSYEVAFTKHESKARYAIEKVNQWRADLTKVGNLSGWDSKNHKSERELVEDIVTFVLKKVCQAPPGDFEELEGTREAMDVVKKMLNDDKFTAIGVFGRGGVGKTAMVKHVSEQAQRTGLFDQVVMAVISRNPDLRKIQGSLVKQLGLELVEDEEIDRASRLKERIMGGKKILIILDDIWEEINLSSIGIPSYDELQKCNSKVLLTTRVRNVCESMGCQSHIPLNVLSEEDSMKLLMKKLGKPFHESTISDEERNAVRKCAGLPHLLEEVARALGRKYIEEWNEAVSKAFGDNDNELQKPAEKLNASQLVHNKDERDTFKRIKISYHALTFDDAKSFFLLCCMFPEDYDIPIEELFKYGIGNGLFQSFDTLQEARARAHSLVAYLKASGLLLDGKKGCIRMHCDIRNVAMSIALSEGHAIFVKAGCGLKDWPMDAREGYSAISLMMNKLKKLPETLVCSKLEILLLQSNASICDIPETLFQSPNALRVFDLSHTSISVLPSSFDLLTSLQALYLDFCDKIIDISVIGKLRKVEILSLRKFPHKELPKEVGNLTSLRMLDVTGGRVHRIPSEVISRLYRLEELYMKCEFGNWGSKVEEAVGQTNANFDEIIGLSRLNNLKVYISDAACLPKDIGNSEPSWVKFDICISRNLSSDMMLSQNDKPSTTLTLDRTINGLSDWFINLVIEKTEKLEYRECKEVINILNEHEHGRLRGLKRLNVNGCHENLEELINATRWDPSEPVFKSLEELHLLHLKCLKEICVGELPLGSLCNLKLLKVQTCCSLVNALLPPKLLQRLTNLETIFCVNMVQMKYVFGTEGLELGTILLTKLSEMRLCALSELISIWDGPAPHAVFRNLKVLAVCKCKKLTNLFPFDVARSLLQLEDLSVERCHNMVRVIEACSSLNRYISFPGLKKLTLINLPELTCLCTENGSIDVECPRLEYLYVDKCPQFINTASASVKLSDQHLNSLAKRWEDMYKL